MATPFFQLLRSKHSKSSLTFLTYSLSNLSPNPVSKIFNMPQIQPLCSYFFYYISCFKWRSFSIIVKSPNWSSYRWPSKVYSQHNIWRIHSLVGSISSTDFPYYAREKSQLLTIANKNPLLPSHLLPLWSILVLFCLSFTAPVKQLGFNSYFTFFFSVVVVVLFKNWNCLYKVLVQ